MEIVVYGLKMVSITLTIVFVLQRKKKQSKLRNNSIKSQSMDGRAEIWHTQKTRKRLYFFVKLDERAIDLTYIKVIFLSLTYF